MSQDTSHHENHSSKDSIDVLWEKVKQNFHNIQDLKFNQEIGMEESEKCSNLISQIVSLDEKVEFPKDLSDKPKDSKVSSMSRNLINDAKHYLQINEERNESTDSISKNQNSTDSSSESEENDSEKIEERNPKFAESSNQNPKDDNSSIIENEQEMSEESIQKSIQEIEERISSLKRKNRELEIRRKILEQQQMKVEKETLQCKNEIQNEENNLEKQRHELRSTKAASNLIKKLFQDPNDSTTEESLDQIFESLPQVDNTCHEERFREDLNHRKSKWSKKPRRTSRERSVDSTSSRGTSRSGKRYSNSKDERTRTKELDIGLGKIYRGKINCMKPYGCFVTFYSGYKSHQGLVHISNVSDEAIPLSTLEEKYPPGKRVYVAAIDIAEEGNRISLSMRHVDQNSGRAHPMFASFLEELKSKHEKNIYHHQHHHHISKGSFSKGDLLGNSRFSDCKYITLKMKEALSNLNLENMTIMQEKVMSLQSLNHDICVAYSKDFGKKMAFLITCIDGLEYYGFNYRDNIDFGVIIVASSLESAMAIEKEAKKLLSFFPHLTCGVLGGGIAHELELLKRGLNIIICTPRKLVDHLKNTKNFSKKVASSLKYLVFEDIEACIDRGYEQEAEESITRIRPGNWQVLMFSPTSNSEIWKFARKLGKEVIIVEE